MKDPRRRNINEFERIQQHLDGLALRVDIARQPIGGWQFRQGRHLDAGRYEFDGDWLSYDGREWGGEDVTAFFRAATIIPESMRGQTVIARLYPGGEGILRVDGEPCAGIDFSHREYELMRDARPGQAFELELECYFRDAPDDAIRNDIRTRHRFALAELVVKDALLESLWYDLAVTLDLALATRQSRPELSERLVRAAAEAMAMLPPHASSGKDYRDAAAAAGEFLHGRIFDTGCDRLPGELFLVGGCHLDLWYVWPYRESLRKNLRTNLIALDLIAHDPRYIFSQSQAKLFADMKDAYPGPYERVKAAAAQGRFEPMGGTWVEMDGNIPCGEALVRQVLYGQRFFQREFGRRSTICWHSDIFGVCGSLPQILIEGGFKVFYTNKHAIWHDTNEFPHTTFWWEGIDGSRIVTHIPPTHFVGKMDPESLILQWQENRQKAAAPCVLYTYGFGDGGGGPTPRMLEYAGRLDRMDGMPRLRLSSAEQFADSLTRSAGALPVWADELYLEAHRGVLTTKGPLKRANRQAEVALRNAEILSAMAEWLAPDHPPDQTLEQSWKRLLECHFHDAVTGTHCTEAGVEIARQYEQVLRTAEQRQRDAISSLVRDDAGRAAVLNLTGAVAEGHVTWDSPEDLTLHDGHKPLTTQRLSDGRLLTYVEALPALGHKTFALASAEPAGRAACPFRLLPDGIESSSYRLRFDESGRIAELLDLAAGRGAMAGAGNQFSLYEDKPGRFEAWDIAKDFADWPVDEIRLLDIQAGQSGPLLASKILRLRIGESLLTQEVILYAHSRRIDFVTSVDWQESQRLLRVSFPLNVLSRQAVYEIPCGVLARQTQPTSPYDKAKFEAPLQRWLDVGQHDYGVAILNDGKYGGCVNGNIASLSLLRSPRWPDPTSDLGRHQFTYSLLPHQGSWQEARVMEQAALLNNPLILRRGGLTTDQAAYLSISRAGLSLEAFKRAEDGQGWIIRLVDYYGQSGETTVSLPLPPRRVTRCNILEDDVGDVPCRGDSFSFTCRPFGLHTFRIT